MNWAGPGLTWALVATVVGLLALWIALRALLAVVPLGVHP